MRATSGLPLGARLATDRLRHRERRMELVVRELRRTADERRRADGEVPSALTLAIESFESELRSMRRRG